MGWEERNGNRYYYSKRRTADGRVVSEYVGRGWVAELAANLDETVQEDRALRRLETRLEFAPIDTLLEQTLALEREVRQLMKANLLSTGHHTHKGQWRRRRMFEPGTKGKVSLRLTKEEGTDEVNALLQRCDTEEPADEDVAALREWLRATDEPYRRALDMTMVAREGALAMAGGDSALVRESVRLGLERFHDALGYAGSSPLERVLIEQAGACWLVLQAVQRRYTTTSSGEHRLSLMQHYEKRLSKAQRRFERAVLTLERVRKLRRRGPVQVNVAAAGGTFQQVNSATPT